MNTKKICKLISYDACLLLILALSVGYFVANIVYYNTGYVNECVQDISDISGCLNNCGCVWCYTNTSNIDMTGMCHKSYTDNCQNKYLMHGPDCRRNDTGSYVMYSIILATLMISVIALTIYIFYYVAKKAKKYSTTGTTGGSNTPTNDHIDL